MGNIISIAISVAWQLFFCVLVLPIPMLWLKIRYKYSVEDIFYNPKAWAWTVATANLTAFLLGVFRVLAFR